MGYMDLRSDFCIGIGYDISYTKIEFCIGK